MGLTSKDLSKSFVNYIFLASGASVVLGSLELGVKYPVFQSALFLSPTS